MSNPDNKQEYGRGGASAHYILVVCTLLYVVNFMDRQVLSAVLQPMKVELGLTDAQCGLLQTIFILGVAVFTFPFSYLMDRWNRKKPMAIMAILWSIFTYFTGLANSFISLVIPRALVGVGEAGFSSGGTAMISGAYTRTESRGGHARRDFTTRNDEKWLKHTLAFCTDKGPKLDYKPVTITNWLPVERKY